MIIIKQQHNNIACRNHCTSQTLRTNKGCTIFDETQTLPVVNVAPLLATVAHATHKKLVYTDGIDASDKQVMVSFFMYETVQVVLKGYRPSIGVLQHRFREQLLLSLCGEPSIPLEFVGRNVKSSLFVFSPFLPLLPRDRHLPVVASSGAGQSVVNKTSDMTVRANSEHVENITHCTINYREAIQ